jgi:TonB-dependent SusC/RagA subfamily outer membrane receptor
LKVTGAAHFSITQQINFSSLKKRIIMMNRSRSAKIQLTRFLFLLPLLTVMLLAFRSNAIGHNTLRLEVAALPDISNLFVEKTAMHADTVPVKDKKGEVKKLKLKQKPSDKAVDCDSVNASGNARIKLANENVLVVVDGVVQKQGANLKQINAEDIQEINVLKNAHAEEIYGHAAKGKDGVIEIVTKGHTSRVHNDGKVTILGDSVVFNGTSSITAKPSLNDVGKLYVVDGIELSAAEFEKLDLEPNRIESVTVLKGESATKIYGAKASKGAIIIKLKKVVTLSTPPEQKKNGSMPQISDN